MYDWKNSDIWTNRKNWETHPSSKSIILTFDDGPSSVLSKVLDILNKHDVKAMFFWQSRLLYKERPWKRVIDEGHMIGGHSLRHRDLTKLNMDEQFRDINKNKRQIEQLTGQLVKYFRPPFGQFNEDTLQVLKSLNLVPFLWEVAGLDWEHKDYPDHIIHNIINYVNDGSIILLHELKQTAAILDDLICELKEEGYSFVLPPTS
ncbi:polysaccharide deacetylase family protein [Fictibacillus barbaricus]|uniref:Peptidoglycan/xylan/chitin deacetylase (PgdA/CDA1 family) n=1 Tax=Fictibacillus barbaricus TaxID=182136 RepID=A0ABU1TV93_9BACL|nr:polysaccharide deacetylase family protein [Fictibacillus barbaricus]MDR7071124.1 peptidoglycan/xylan/chitin deacetylase (PgdA/CDA1 family) [Fictibacillus barbaricus]